MENYKNNLSSNIEYISRYFKNKHTLAKYLDVKPMIVSRSINKASVGVEKIALMAENIHLDSGWLLNNPESFKIEFHKCNRELIEKFNHIGSLTAKDFNSKSNNQILKMIIWNVQWATPGSERQKIIDKIIKTEDPDIICVTESYLESWNDYPFVVGSEDDYGYKIIDGRRKVILISKEQFTDIDMVGNSSLPTGRFIKAKTYGMNVYGVCIPWKDAHVRTGRKDKASWQDHIEYLDGLRDLLNKDDAQSLIVGDYNQRIPKQYSSKKAFEALMRTFNNFHIHTKDIIRPINKQSIDHFASTKPLGIHSICSIDNMHEGSALSDHFGLIIEFSL